MSTYQPTSRRPIADTLRKTASISVRLCVKCNVHPNAVSILSILASAGAGICFYLSGQSPWLVIAAAALCYLRLWFNMLDGMVALASNKASRLGEVFNEMPDRASDVIILAGVAHSGLCNPIIAYWAIIMALAVAYVGTFGQAVGVGRQFGGLMSKPWRMVLLHIGSWAALGWAYWLAGNQVLRRAFSTDIIASYMTVPFWHGPTLMGEQLSIMDWTLIIIVLGCVQTLCVRLWRIVSALKKDV